MKKILFITLLFCFTQTKAQYVTIPDTKFAALLRSAIPSAMNGNLMDTTNIAVKTTTHMTYVNNQQISNLSGVQYFSSLTYLDCSFNLLTSLPPLPKTLDTLSCCCSQLTSLPHLPATLKSLSCAGNKLTTIPTLPDSLTYFDCETNIIHTLPILPNNLIYLSCSGNPISYLPFLPNTLQTLTCVGDSLTSLPTLPSTLTFLNCEYNSITNLPPLPDSLYGLGCDNNQITCFPTFPSSLISPYNFGIDPNPYNCLPNYVPAMNVADMAKPLCQTGNSNSCAIATIKQIHYISNTTIYPNPAQNKITIDAANVIDVKLFDVLGKQIISTKETQLDVSNLNDGVYFVQVKTNTGTSTQKIIVQD